jgi:excisionase family DNA binding protein
MKSSTRKADQKAEPMLMPVGEAARLLSISQRSVWRLADRGELPRVQLGARAVRFRRVDVEKVAGLHPEGGIDE